MPTPRIKSEANTSEYSKGDRVIAGAVVSAAAMLALAGCKTTDAEAAPLPSDTEVATTIEATPSDEPTLPEGVTISPSPEASENTPSDVEMVDFSEVSAEADPETTAQLVADFIASWAMTDADPESAKALFDEWSSKNDGSTIEDFLFAQAGDNARYFAESVFVEDWEQIESLGLLYDRLVDYNYNAMLEAIQHSIKGEPEIGLEYSVSDAMVIDVEGDAFSVSFVYTEQGVNSVRDTVANSQQVWKFETSDAGEVRVCDVASAAIS